MASGTATVTSSSGLNVRKGPSTSYAKLGALSKGAKVNYSSDSNGWLQIKYNNTTGYICKQYTSVTQGTTSGGGTTSSSSGSVRVTASSGLNVRKGPSTSYGKIGLLSYNAVVSYSGEQNGWLKISYAGQTGYISKQYTTPASGSTGGSTGDTVIKTATVTCDVLNVRNGAGTGYSKIGTVSRGASLSVYKEQGDWLQVKYGSGKGWVCKSYTSLGSGGSSGGGGGTVAGLRANTTLRDKVLQVEKEMPGSGWCATGVARAIERTYSGVDIWGNGNTIHQSLECYPKYFKKVNASLSDALKVPGIILTWQSTATAAGQKYGHTAITIGNGSSSCCDYYENNTLGVSGRTGLRVYTTLQ